MKIDIMHTRDAYAEMYASTILILSVQHVRVRSPEIIYKDLNENRHNAYPGCIRRNVCIYDIDIKCAACTCKKSRNYLQRLYLLGIDSC